MGGADKGLLLHAGRPLVEHAIERLRPQVAGLLISANRNLDTYRAYGFPVVTDPGEERFGPLAGIQAGLQACRTDWLVTCPCDCPNLPRDLVARLLAAATQAAAPLAVAATAEGLQPGFQLLRRDLLPMLTSYLAAGNRRAGAWCRDHGAVDTLFPDGAAFRNLNSPENLGQA